MNKFIQLLRLLPYLLKRRIRRWRKRRPDEGFYLLKMDGDAYFIWTPNGNVLLSRKASSLLSAKLEKLSKETYHEIR